MEQPLFLGTVSEIRRAECFGHRAPGLSLLLRRPIQQSTVRRYHVILARKENRGGGQCVRLAERERDHGGACLDQCSWVSLIEKAQKCTFT